jgi:hypothetical protein
MLKRNVRISLIIVIVLGAAIARADTPVHPISYSVLSADGKFTFVMIAPVNVKEDGDFESDERKAEAQKVRAKYKTSGLYRNDGSTTPLWTVNWYARNVYVASDGVHLVRRGPATERLDDEAFTFFAEGTEVRSYTVGNLVGSTLLLPRTAAYFDWEKSITLDNNKRTLTVTTNAYDKYVFDIVTGEIIFTRKLTWVVGACVVIASTFGLIKIAQKLRRQRHSPTDQSA